MKFHRFAIIGLTATLLCGCDSRIISDPEASSGPGKTDPPGTVQVVKAVSFTKIDFEAETGATIAGALTGHNPESISFPVEVNRDTPLAGNASARIKAVFNGTKYSAYAWTYLNWGLSKEYFELDATGAKGIRITIRANENVRMDVIPSGNSSVYTKEQNDSGVQMVWSGSVVRGSQVVDLLFEGLAYHKRLYDSGRPCAIDPVRNCPDKKAKLLANLTGLNFTLLSTGSNATRDTVWVDIDDIELIDPSFGSDFSGRTPTEIPWNIAVAYGSVRDAAGQPYRTVAIGAQTWMAENLNYKVDSSWWYEGNADSGVKYGSLYTWAAMMDLPDSCNRRKCANRIQTRHQGICPTGWHVPSDTDWAILGRFLGGDSIADNKLKSASGWEPSFRQAWYVSGNGTDAYGFRALPAGLLSRNENGTFFHAGFHLSFRSSAEYDVDRAWTHHLFSDGDRFSRSYTESKGMGCSVRCLKDGP